jgi:hypothetical protein
MYKAEFGFGPPVEEMKQRQALTCWEHLYGWPAVRDMAATFRAMGHNRHAELLLQAARDTKPPVFRWVDVGS